MPTKLDALEILEVVDCGYWGYVNDTLTQNEGYVVWRTGDYGHTTVVLELAIAIGGEYNNIITSYNPIASICLPKNWIPS